LTSGIVGSTRSPTVSGAVDDVEADGGGGADGNDDEGGGLLMTVGRLAEAGPCGGDDTAGPTPINSQQRTNKLLALRIIQLSSKSFKIDSLN
jgi:hypothetical protein